MSEALELFQAVIDEHRRRPRHRGPLPTANRVVTRENPACGDRCTLQFQIAPDSTNGSSSAPRILAAGFTGAGCALSQASASLATSTLHARSCTEALVLITAVTRLVRGTSASGRPVTLPSDIPDLPEELATFATLQAHPARHGCALLAWDAALAALTTEFA
jgi:nitrogen fixation NifU-like protein